MDSSKIQSIQDKVEDVKLQMVTNIEQTMKREEKLHLLMDKSEDLAEQSNRFREGARTLKKSLCTKNVKMISAFGGAIGLVAFIVYIMIKLD